MPPALKNREPPSMTRREFMKWVVTGGAALLFSSCFPDNQRPPQCSSEPETSSEAEMQADACSTEIPFEHLPFDTILTNISKPIETTDQGLLSITIKTQVTITDMVNTLKKQQDDIHIRRWQDDSLFANTVHYEPPYRTGKPITVLLKQSVGDFDSPEDLGVFVHEMTHVRQLLDGISSQDSIYTNVDAMKQEAEADFLGSIVEVSAMGLSTAAQWSEQDRYKKINIRVVAVLLDQLGYPPPQSSVFALVDCYRFLHTEYYMQDLLKKLLADGSLPEDKYDQYTSELRHCEQRIAGFCDVITQMRDALSDDERMALTYIVNNPDAVVPGCISM